MSYPKSQNDEKSFYPDEEKNGKKYYPDALNTNETEWYPNAKETIDKQLIPKIDRTKQNFILLAGFPGAGKSSVILPLLKDKFLLKDESGDILENNLFIISGDNGVNNANIVYGMGNFTKFEKNLIEKTNVNENLKTALEEKKIILIDKPFLTIDDEITELKKWIGAIKKEYENANIFVIYLNIPCEIAYNNAIKRCEKDKRKGCIPLKLYDIYNTSAKKIFFDQNDKNLLNIEGINYIQLEFSKEEYTPNERCKDPKADEKEIKPKEIKLDELMSGGKRKQTRQNKKTRKTRKKTRKTMKKTRKKKRKTYKRR